MSQYVINALQKNLQKVLRQGHWGEAEIILETLKTEDPTGRVTRILELELLVVRGQWREAEGVVQVLRTLYADSSRFNYLAGRVAYAEKRYTAARDLLAESLRQYQSSEAARWLGRTLTQLGELDEARDVLMELLRAEEQRRPGQRAFVSSMLLKDLAWLSRRQGNNALALEYYERAQALNPADEWLKCEILKVRGAMLSAAAVEDEIQQLKLAGEPVSPDLYLTWVEKLLEQGLITEARTAMKDPVAASLPSGHNLRLGWICYRAGAYDIAFNLFLPLLIIDRLTDFKFINALEKAAQSIHREVELLARYEELAPSCPRLYGKIKRLKARAGSLS